MFKFGLIRTDAKEAVIEDTEQKLSPPPLPFDNRKREIRKFPGLSKDEAMEIIHDKCPAINTDHYGYGTDKVIFLPNATNKLLSIVDWGMKTPNNRYEQIYQGMGHIFVNDDHRVMIISHILYIYAAERTPVSASIYKDTFDSIMERIEYERDIYIRNEKSCNSAGKGKVFDPFIKYGPSEVVMYGHTHPGLGCFFSGPDRRSGFACEDLPAVTFVLDPIDKDMKAMTGVEERDAEVIVCSYKGNG